MSPIDLRRPSTLDAPAVAELVRRCPPLDMNSLYCNLLQCSHFADCAVVADCCGKLVGSVTGYRLPEQPDVLFIWQVAVLELARGQGLARRMLQHLLARSCHADVRYVETTITADNKASWRLFQGLAAASAWPQEKSLLFDGQRDFGGAHPSEYLLRLGPLAAASVAV